MRESWQALLRTAIVEEEEGPGAFAGTKKHNILYAKAHLQLNPKGGADHVA